MVASHAKQSLWVSLAMQFQYIKYKLNQERFIKEPSCLTTLKTSVYQRASVRHVDRCIIMSTAPVIKLTKLQKNKTLGWTWRSNIIGKFWIDRPLLLTTCGKPEKNPGWWAICLLCYLDALTWNSSIYITGIGKSRQQNELSYYYYYYYFQGGC